MSVYPYAHPMIPVIKKELAYTGPFGLFAYLSGCLFIDRCKSDEAKQKMNEKVLDIKKKKVNRIHDCIYLLFLNNFEFDFKVEVMDIS